MGHDVRLMPARAHFPTASKLKLSNANLVGVYECMPGKAARGVPFGGRIGPVLTLYDFVVSRWIKR